MRGNAPADQLVPLERVAESIAFLLSDSGAGVSGQLITLSASS
jgi:enoyl-[acyl-carrier-protein] reductase (NADH)